MLERLHNHIILGMLDIFLTVSTVFVAFLGFKIGAQCRDHIHVQASDIVVVVMDLLILLVVLRFELSDGFVLLRLNLGNFSFTSGLHVLAQARHLRLVLLLNFVGDALILLPLVGGQGVVMLVKSVTVFRLADFLLLLLDF